MGVGRKGVGASIPAARWGRLLHSPKGEAAWSKAPRVRLPVLFFREGARGAALQGVPSASEVHRADPFGNEAHTAGPSSFVVFPGIARYGFVTGGARVCQVGVNPPGRAVVVVGVDAVERPSDPWPEKARRTASRKGRRHLVERGLPRAKLEVGQHVGVLGGHSIAEAGKRHVA